MTAISQAWAVSWFLDLIYHLIHCNLVHPTYRGVQRDACTVSVSDIFQFNIQAVMEVICTTCLVDSWSESRFIYSTYFRTLHCHYAIHISSFFFSYSLFIPFYLFLPSVLSSPDGGGACGDHKLLRLGASFYKTGTQAYSDLQEVLECPCKT
jgi:hypothetical protein